MTPPTGSPSSGSRSTCSSATRTKMFCACAPPSAREPNTRRAPCASGCRARCRCTNAQAIELRPDASALAFDCADRAAVACSRARTTSIRTCPRATRSPSTTCRCATNGRARIRRRRLGIASRIWRRTRARSCTRDRRAGSTGPTLAGGLQPRPARRSSRWSPSRTCTRPRRRGDWLSLLRVTLRRLGVNDVQHGGGVAALRRQRLGAPARRRASSARRPSSRTSTPSAS